MQAFLNFHAAFNEHQQHKIGAKDHLRFLLSMLQIITFVCTWFVGPYNSNACRMWILIQHIRSFQLFSILLSFSDVRPSGYRPAGFWQDNVLLRCSCAVAQSAVTLRGPREPGSRCRAVPGNGSGRRWHRRAHPPRRSDGPTAAGAERRPRVLHGISCREFGLAPAEIAAVSKERLLPFRLSGPGKKMQNYYDDETRINAGKCRIIIVIKQGNMRNACECIFFLFSGQCISLTLLLSNFW